jgi:hypothetical protein
LAYPKSAEVDFTEASWSPTQLAEVDATDAPEKLAQITSVWITSVISAPPRLSTNQ